MVDFTSILAGGTLPPKPITVPSFRTPEEQAELDALEKATGLIPPPSPLVQQQLKERKVNQDVEEAPATQRYLERPENVIKAQDHTEELSVIEKISKNMEELGEAFEEYRTNGRAEEEEISDALRADIIRDWPGLTPLTEDVLRQFVAAHQTDNVERMRRLAGVSEVGALVPLKERLKKAIPAPPAPKPKEKSVEEVLPKIPEFIYPS